MDHYSRKKIQCLYQLWCTKVRWIFQIEGNKVFLQTCLRYNTHTKWFWG